jgi:hypothetical protein
MQIPEINNPLDILVKYLLKKNQNGNNTDNTIALKPMSNNSPSSSNPIKSEICW